MVFSLNFVAVALILTVSGVFSTNVLLVMPVPSPSHFVWHKALIHALAAKGHNVTVLSTDIETNSPPNVHYIDLDGVYEELHSGFEADFSVMTNPSHPLQNVMFFYMYAEMSCAAILKSRGLTKLLSYPKTFKWDVIVYDNCLGGCLFGLMDHFNYPPLALATAFNNPPFTSDYVGGHKFFTYVPHYALPYTSEMTFFQRVYNAIVYAVDVIYHDFIFTGKCNKMARKVFGPNMPDISTLQQKAAIALVNSNPAVDFAEPVPPNVIQVGGLQIIKPKPLPKDVEDFINAGKKGAVLFSLGTNIKSNSLGEERINTILESLRQIPDYNFIWKFESDKLPAPQPSNVMIKKWLSQNDILAHKKIKAFISHSGLLSTHEAAYYGVPVVGIPFFSDQHRNIQKSVVAGVATVVDIRSLSVKDLTKAILDVLQDPKYSQNMKIRSDKFRDQPEHPLDRAVWWIEYLMRNPKPSHLRVPTLEMGFFKANHYDIILFTALIVHIFVFLVRKVLKCYKLQSPKSNSNKKNN